MNPDIYVRHLKFLRNLLYGTHRIKRAAGLKIAILSAGLSIFAVIAAAPGSAQAITSPDHSFPPRAGKHITMLQIGDLHGHMIPRPNLRSDGTGLDEGGLSRLYTQIQRIRAQNRNVLLFNTGDTIQGGAEALYTEGQSMVDVLDRFGIDGMAPATGTTSTARTVSWNSSDPAPVTVLRERVTAPSRPTFITRAPTTCCCRLIS